jgi:hypothetical protein
MTTTDFWFRLFTLLSDILTYLLEGFLYLTIFITDPLIWLLDGFLNLIIFIMDTSNYYMGVKWSLLSICIIAGLLFQLAHNEHRKNEDERIKGMILEVIKETKIKKI